MRLGRREAVAPHHLADRGQIRRAAGRGGKDLADLAEVRGSEDGGVAIARNFASTLPRLSNLWICPRDTHTASPGPISTVSASIVHVETPSRP